MRHQKNGVLAAVVFLALSWASSGFGYTLPTQEALAPFFPPPPPGWVADAGGQSGMGGLLDGMALSQKTYMSPSGRVVTVSIDAVSLGPVPEVPDVLPGVDLPDDGAHEGPQCRLDHKKYDVQGFHVDDVAYQCPEGSGHSLSATLVESGDFLYIVSIDEDGSAADDGTLKAMLESMNLKGLRSLAG